MKKLFAVVNSEGRMAVIDGHPLVSDTPEGGAKILELGRMIKQKLHPKGFPLFYVEFEAKKTVELVEGN